MNYRIETKEAFRIVGKSFPLSKEIAQNFLEVPQMWQGAVLDGAIEKIISLMNKQPQGVLGCSPFNDLSCDCANRVRVQKSPGASVWPQGQRI